MNEPIYDQRGQVVGWLGQDALHDLDGRYRAFIDSGHIYSWRTGAHVGWFEDGWIWDSRMTAVAFLRGAGSGPAKPGLAGTPGRPGMPGMPGRPGRAGAPGRPGKSNSWSDQSWETWSPPAV